jgi:hypothetical protein
MKATPSKSRLVDQRGRLLVAALGFAGVLAGCGSTLSELRQASPQRTATVMADRPALVSCIISGLRVADPGTFRVLAGGLIYQTEESATLTEIIG